MLRVATWNVNSVRSHLAQVMGWVEENQPDVLALQETMVSPARFPTKDFAGLGYEVVAHGSGGRGGVAIASRLSLSDVTTDRPGAVAPFDEPRLVSVSLADRFGGARIRIHCCYAPNGRKVGTDHHRFKLAWFEYLAAVLDADRGAHLDDSHTVETLVLGDLNIAPTDLDVWDAHRYRSRNLTSPAERAAFEQLLAGAGAGTEPPPRLVDVVRLHLSDTHGYSWWNRRGDFYESDRGWRLDHILASPGIASTSESLHIDRATRGQDGSSDHAPIQVDFTG